MFIKRYGFVLKSLAIIRSDFILKSLVFLRDDSINLELIPEPFIMIHEFRNKLFTNTSIFSYIKIPLLYKNSSS